MNAKHQSPYTQYFFFPGLPRSSLWMWGITPPPGIVALIRMSSSSSPRIASCKCLGVILLTLKSLEAFPASSSTSAVRYSRIAALYTAAVAPTLFLEETRFFKNLWIRPTGNYEKWWAIWLRLSYLKSRPDWSGQWCLLGLARTCLAAFSSFSFSVSHCCVLFKDFQF